MTRLMQWWKDVSISKKLYFVVGVMAILIIGELVTLRFAMDTLSAARAFVGGESLWSKAQKNAVHSLQRYGNTHDERDYQVFLDFLKVPEGDHEARIELMKPHPDIEIVRRGFIQGRIHSNDVEPIVRLLRRFYWISYMSRAIDVWSRADALLVKLKQSAEGYRQAILRHDDRAFSERSNEIKDLNAELTNLEEDFSAVLGEGSRWLEHIVLTVLLLAVLTVETIGLSLTFFTSRSLSRGLFELETVATSIGTGNFSRRVGVRSKDELGRLGAAVNRMGSMLERSYRNLEARVAARTSELAKMAEENSRLYEEAKSAVKTRDEFLSIASHELRTPLTSLYLEVQTLERVSQGLTEGTVSERVKSLTAKAVRSTQRLQTLLDELLDMTRLRTGQLEIRPERCDLVQVVCDVVSHFGLEAARHGSAINIEAAKPVPGEFDVNRVGQIVTNLVSNAIKYGDGKPITVNVSRVSGRARVSVRDHGRGIPPELHAKIFERFQRAEAEQSDVPGLGLGLYITKQIVERHGGMISVESSPGHGSTFTVEL